MRGRERGYLQGLRADVESTPAQARVSSYILISLCFFKYMIWAQLTALLSCKEAAGQLWAALAQ